MLGIAQGLLRLLRTKPPRKLQSVVRNSWCCTHLLNLVPSITFLINSREPEEVSCTLGYPVEI